MILSRSKTTIDVEGVPGTFLDDGNVQKWGLESLDSGSSPALVGLRFGLGLDKT